MIELYFRNIIKSPDFGSKRLIIDKKYKSALYFCVKCAYFYLVLHKTHSAKPQNSLFKPYQPIPPKIAPAIRATSARGTYTYLPRAMNQPPIGLSAPRLISASALSLPST